MSTIRGIKAREILDGRGIPTIEIILWIKDGRSVITSVPTELAYTQPKAKILRDNDQQEFNGRGVKKAINNINEIIAPKLVGMSVIQQGKIDQTLINIDGTKDKSKMGANSLLAVSMAVAKAGALSVGLPLYSYIQQKYNLTEYLSLPNCIYDLINGGDFGNDNLDFQEFHLIPASHIEFPNSIAMASTLKQKIQDVIETKGGSVCSGPLGGYLPRMNSNMDVFELIMEAVKTTSYTFAQDVFFGFDAAADSFAVDSSYALRDQPDHYSSKKLMKFYNQIRELYKTIYIEDPFRQEDEKAWQKITEELGETTKITGDIFFQGDIAKIKKAIKDKNANSVSIKLLDRGTISETVQTAKVAKDADWQVVISQNSGETNESFIADLAVGVGANYVKFGPPNRGERVCKYNRLIRIYEELHQE